MANKKKVYVSAYLRKYRKQVSKKWGFVWVPDSDTFIDKFKSPIKAYQKTKRLEKRDYKKGIVQHVWFQTSIE